MLLDKALEGVLLELVDIGGEGNGGQDGADGCDVTHCDMCEEDWGRSSSGRWAVEGEGVVEQQRRGFYSIERGVSERKCVKFQQRRLSFH